MRKLQETASGKSGFFLFFYVSLFILRESAQGGEGREREGERERMPSRLRAARKEPDAGLEVM